MDVLRVLHDPKYVAKFQKLCGVEVVKPVTCDQETQTRRNSSDRENGNSGGEEDNQFRYASTPGAPGLGDNTENVFGNGSINSQVRQRTLQTESSALGENSLSSESNIHTSNRKYRYQNGEFNNNTDEGYPKHRDRSGKDDGISATTPPSFTQSKPLVNIKYKSLLYLAHLGAFLGNEEFYLTFFPFCVWNMDSLIVRQVSMLWCLVMYLGQGTKDYLMWPRPPCPPVIRLETSYIQEYSMPSTHAMAGTAIPIYLAYLVVDRYQVPVVLAALVALLWFSVTCLSRLYLGVHSFLDLLAGVVYSFLIFCTFLRYVEGYDFYQQTNPFAGLLILAAALTLCTLTYPSSHKNSSKGDAVQIVAAVAGSAIGSWMGYQLGYMQEPEITKPYFIEMPSMHWLGMSMLRFITGLMVVGVVHTVAKYVSLRGFSFYYGLDTPDKNHPSVQTAYKFTTYTIIGITIMFFIPLLHLWAGIARPMVFYEVF